MRKKPAFLFCLVLIALGHGLAGCDQGFREDHSGPGRRPQQLALSPDEELELGREAYAQVLRKYRGRILPADDSRTRLVRYVMGKLIRAVGIEPLQREINLRLRGYTFEWAANVAESDEINAFCLPGGKMIVFTGILHVTRNDDQVATVMGHEMAHALAHHANERVARDASGHVSFFRGKAYDRAQESEADHIGLFLMTFADFDPRQAIRFWQEMEQRAQGGHLPEFLSDHPSGAHRIRDLEMWLPQVLAAKKAFEEGRIAPALRR